MAEENEFFRPIREIEQRRVVSCSADDTLVDIVGRMREMSISCVVVVEGEDGPEVRPNPRYVAS